MGSAWSKTGPAVRERPPDPHRDLPEVQPADLFVGDIEQHRSGSVRRRPPARAQHDNRLIDTTVTDEYLLAANTFRFDFTAPSASPCRDKSAFLPYRRRRRCCAGHRRSTPGAPMAQIDEQFDSEASRAPEPPFFSPSASAALRRPPPLMPNQRPKRLKLRSRRRRPQRLRRRRSERSAVNPSRSKISPRASAPPSCDTTQRRRSTAGTSCAT